MKINQVWASIIGLAFLTIGVLIFIIPSLSLSLSIAPVDGAIHVATVISFLTGIWIKKGKYVNNPNIFLGVFYIIFGISGFNWAHIIIGTIS